MKEDMSCMVTLAMVTPAMGIRTEKVGIRMGEEGIRTSSAVSFGSLCMISTNVHSLLSGR
jgi:hypothetical protein